MAIYLQQILNQFQKNSLRKIPSTFNKFDRRPCVTTHTDNIQNGLLIYKYVSSSDLLFRGGRNRFFYPPNQRSKEHFISVTSLARFFIIYCFSIIISIHFTHKTESKETFAKWVRGMATKWQVKLINKRKICHFQPTLMFVVIKGRQGCSCKRKKEVNWE